MASPGKVGHRRLCRGQQQIESCGIILEEYGNIPELPREVSQQINNVPASAAPTWNQHRIFPLYSTLEVVL